MFASVLHMIKKAKEMAGFRDFLKIGGLHDEITEDKLITYLRDRGTKYKIKEIARKHIDEPCVYGVAFWHINTIYLNSIIHRRMRTYTALQLYIGRKHEHLHHTEEEIDFMNCSLAYYVIPKNLFISCGNAKSLAEKSFMPLDVATMAWRFNSMISAKENCPIDITARGGMINQP